VSEETTSSQSPNKDQQSDEKSAYVLVTPVRNEETFIGRTIQSVINQTIHPKEWVIMSDGSTDSTNSIIENAQKNNSWIRLFKLPKREKPSWSAVVDNTTLGIKSIKCETYSFLGLLDADLEFQPFYFERLIAKFHDDSNLGLSGGNTIDIGRPKTYIPRNLNEVPGAVQFFTRECFESLGGMKALPEGGWDALTAASARKNGFKTQLAADLFIDHLKPNNITSGGIAKRRWQRGVRDYALGYHPLFEAIKCIDLIREKPYLISAFFWFSGYLSCHFLRRKRTLNQDLIRFIQTEQINRLAKLFTRNR
jgi:poly-beta-1,6-N-acetyl-D-glucosamine synthase